MTTDEIFAQVRAGQLNRVPGGISAEKLAKARDSGGWSALHAAARHNILDQIAGGVTIAQMARARNDEGWTALHVAAKYNSLCQIRGELTVQALEKVADNEGRTVLHSVVYNHRLDQLHGRITAEQLLAVRDHKGYSVLSEIGSQVTFLDGGATFEQLAAAQGRYGFRPVNRLAEFGQLGFIRSGVTTLQLRSQKPDKSDDALLVALWLCPLDQIRGGVPAGLVSAVELNWILASTLQFDGKNASELIRLGADSAFVLEAIRNANSNILAGNNGKYGLDQTIRMRMLLRLASDFELPVKNLIDPMVTAMLI